MRCRVLGLLVAGLMAASCASIPEVVAPTATGPTTTSLAPTTTSSFAPTTTSTDTTATTSGLEGSVGGEIVLIANDNGAFRMSEGVATAFVEGPVYQVMSDHQGGFLFQRALSPGEVYWIPAGGTEPQTVVTPGDDHTIVLHDVAIGDKGATLWYTRSTGSAPDDARDVLYTKSMNTGEEIELGVVGGWEFGSAFSVSPELVVGEWWAEGYHGFSTYNDSYEPVEAIWNPYGVDGAVDCGPCAHGADVSQDGTRVAWIEGREAGGSFAQTLVVLDVTTGQPVSEVPLPDGLMGDIFSLDFGRNAVLISHTRMTDSPWLPVMRVDLTDGSITELGIAGNARFATG